ncbi:hypothetical protein H2199_001989 [Coniosporium tulheliwenetii]|uniref:Uncharacterized protein n=1 Tax=Coniosporium tulheliwenetii TaxID=3383036 RepID=A0ACC2ZHF2_9PEZI|nr:hypothetical protein H2199_001989 [Cladosporium sp. JES 115]
MSRSQQASSPLPSLPSSSTIPSTTIVATVPRIDSTLLTSPGPVNPGLLRNARTLPPLALHLPASHWTVPPNSPPTVVLPPLPLGHYFSLEYYFRSPPSAAIEQARRLPPLVLRAPTPEITWSSLPMFPPPARLHPLEYHLPAEERRPQTFTPEQITAWCQWGSRQRIAAERVESDEFRLPPLENHLPPEQRGPQTYSPEELAACYERDTQQTSVAGRAEAAPAVSDRPLRELRPQPLEPRVVMDGVGNVRRVVEGQGSGRPAREGGVAGVEGGERVGDEEEREVSGSRDGMDVDG